MRKIIISVADTGRTEVEITGTDGRFFTKREFDKALRAARIRYHQAKREYQRSKLLNRIGERDVEQRQRRQIESNTEQGIARDSKSEQASTEPSNALTRAVNAKERRNRNLEARKGSSEA